MVTEDRGVEFTSAAHHDTETISVRKRDGRTVSFDRGRIAHAIEMAYRAEIGVPYPDPISSQVAGRIDSVTRGSSSPCRHRSPMATRRRSKRSRTRSSAS